MTSGVFLLGCIRNSRITNGASTENMKSQDLLVATKLASLSIGAVLRKPQVKAAPVPNDWRGWLESKEDELWYPECDGVDEDNPRWTYQELSRLVGISASECNAAVRRGLQARLLRRDRETERPVPIRSSLEEFLIHGFKYVFPSVHGSVVRGIPTCAAAPVLADRLLSATTQPTVWPDGRGISTGIALEPVHRSVPYAVRQDAVLYEILALLDSIRSGRPREANLAAEILVQRLSLLR